MYNLDFNSIRPLGSLNEGFEEFVCQLAHRMNVPNGKRFVRIGRPDGGRECYWELANGDLWMWQAKFFPSSPGVSQFEQISKSVKTALRLHKNIKRYFIAVPQDLPDDGKSRTKSARKRYEEKVLQWQALKGAETIEFVYWGKHELLDLLSRDENEGLVRFWFNKSEFTEKDFELQPQKAIADLGTRYTPELNVELDIAKTFDGLSRNVNFEKRFRDCFQEFKNAWIKIKPSDDSYADCYKIIEEEVAKIIEECARVVLKGIDPLPLNDLQSRIEEVSKNAQVFIERLDQIKCRNYLIYKVREFCKEANRLGDYLKDTECKAANTSVVLLKGEAGTGKSHLLADIVDGRRKEGYYSLLFLGQHFNSCDDPWTQILKQLKFEGTDEEFLLALEAKAESTGNRIFLFIDALNEGGGKELWNKYIRSFIQQIKRHPWLGLVISVRTTYIRAIFGDEVPEGILELSHGGFENHSFDAIRRYFKNYHIDLPSVPLLLPEFKNPLFLKLFCEGLYKNGLTRIDDGMQGVSSIINLFVEGIEKDLSSPKKKDYLPELHLVKKAIDVLIDWQVTNLTTEVPLQEAISLTDGVKTDKFSSGELLYELVSYGVLSRNMRYSNDNQEEEVVYLSYERFNDFFTAQRLLEKSGSAEDSISQFIKDDNSLWFYAGMVESFAIIVPEKEGKEIYDVIPSYRDSDTVVESVMKSLLWRKKTTINKKLVDYFNEVMTDYRYYRFISILIQVGLATDHFFNAEFLHRYLYRMNMAERDYRWSIILRYISGDRDNPVETLLSWAEEDLEKTEVEAESKYLIGIELGWFTTCMDRRIRDRASKALISLVRDDAELMIKLIEKFDGVDDPYITERIYAAAYGCALLSKNTEQLPALAKSVYAHIFDVEGEVYPNALVRDYAKGVIEFTLTLYPELRLGDRPFIPPYNSSFPKFFPTDEETEAYSITNKDGSRITPGIDAILKSMVTEHGYTIYGDFGRYEFQSSLDGWKIDPQKLSNLAVKWIMDRYGYKEELFGQYDRTVGYGRMRQVYPFERVGKKYQWIALHEMVARLSDNFPMQESCCVGTAPYDGTWEPYIRDFDPTMLVRKKIPAWYEPESRYWWNSQDYEEWIDDKSEWVRKYDNLPDPSSVIESVDENGTRWIAMLASPGWVEPHEDDEGAYCSLWYRIRSYIIDEAHYDNLARWALEQDFSRMEMPEVSDRYEMFSREYYWSSAYRYYEKEGMTRRSIYDKKKRIKIADVELPCVRYLWESEYDHSKPGTVSYLKPSKQLFDGMDMRYSNVDGELLDGNGNLLCFDASANHNCHSYFLVRKDALIHYLQSNHKRILWVLTGEKNLIGPLNPRQNWLEMGGAYYLDHDNEVKGSMEVFLDGKIIRKADDKRKKRQRGGD
ncbi:MAG: hypothetical protein IKR88_07360 [Bacteroidales bacterium]|nr:hypothetical protein [Bacteroidales bacterium]